MARRGSRLHIREDVDVYCVEKPQACDSANRARMKYGRRTALAMLTLRIGGCSGQQIAELFGTTRGNVYQRLFGLRCGRYANTCQRAEAEGQTG
jgi:DNA-directed RNA polymerase specialized sigma24 family protein